MKTPSGAQAGSPSRPDQKVTWLISPDSSSRAYRDPRSAADPGPVSSPPKTRLLSSGDQVGGPNAIPAAVPKVLTVSALRSATFIERDPGPLCARRVPSD